MDAFLGDGVLLSVQLAEKHEGCVWQWCVWGRMYMGVCVCMCTYPGSASHWALNTVREKVSAQLCTDLGSTGTEWKAQ